MTEILIIEKKRGNDKLKVKVATKRNNSWNYGGSYQKVIPNKDYKHLSLLFLDLSRMGFPIDKAFSEYKTSKDSPDLFFLD